MNYFHISLRNQDNLQMTVERILNEKNLIDLIKLTIHHLREIQLLIRKL